MSNILRKAVFVQNNVYHLPENRLAEYHGAIFAEEFRKHGVQATKMVLGDPDIDKPISQLLHVSSLKQRLSPVWWKAQGYDLIVFYGGLDLANLPVIRAIKEGLPCSSLILKMDAATGQSVTRPRDLVKDFHRCFMQDRHGHVVNGEHAQNNFLSSMLVAGARTLRSTLPHCRRQYRELFSVPDFVSYELQMAVAQSRNWSRHYKYHDLVDKFIWLGYPVRSEFAEPLDIRRKPGSIISVANWKHAKDLNLHAQALSEVFMKHPTATATLIGEDSAVLQNMILRQTPSSADRIVQISEISNKDLPVHLQSSQVFMLCSFTEGVCSAVIEALCSGCSTALSTGPAVPCFKEFVANDCGTQAKSRSFPDMANAVLNELALWETNARNFDHIRQTWNCTLVPNLCSHICETCGYSYPS